MSVHLIRLQSKQTKNTCIQCLYIGGCFLDERRNLRFLQLTEWTLSALDRGSFGTRENRARLVKSRSWNCEIFKHFELLWKKSWVISNVFGPTWFFLILSLPPVLVLYRGRSPVRRNTPGRRSYKTTLGRWSCKFSFKLSVHLYWHIICKPCRKNPPFFLIPYVRLVVNEEFVVPFAPRFRLS